MYALTSCRQGPSRFRRTVKTDQSLSSSLSLSRSLSNGWIRLCLILIDTARLHASAGQPCPRLMRSSRYQPSAFDLVRCSTTRITKQIEQCRLSRQRQYDSKNLEGLGSPLVYDDKILRRACSRLYRSRFLQIRYSISTFFLRRAENLEETTQNQPNVRNRRISSEEPHLHFLVT